MAVNTTTNSITYTGDGSTKAFSVPFKFIDSSDLVAKLTPSGGSESTLVLGADYTVTGADDDDGGTLTTTAAPAVAASLVISRSTPLTQPTSLPSQGPFSPSVIEDALDRATMGQQDTVNSVASSVTAAVASQYTALAARVTAIESTLNTVSGGSFTTQLNLITQLQQQVALDAALTFVGVTAPELIYSAAYIGFALNSNPRLGPMVFGAAAGALYVGDGNVWLSRTSNVTGTLQAAASSGSVIVVAGTLVSSVPVITSSTDGSTWTAQTNTGTQDITGLVWASSISKFVSIGASGKTMTSTNGATWTTEVATGSGTTWGLAYGNSLLVAFKEGSTSYYTSTNGTSWTSRTAPANIGNGSTSIGACVTWFSGASLWLMACGGFLYTSPDAISWTLRSPQVSSGAPAGLVVTQGNTQVAVFVVKAFSTYRVFTSFDGLTWTERNLPASVSQLTALIPMPGGGLFGKVQSGTANAISGPSFTP